jgi:hypothetical protein
MSTHAHGPKTDPNEGNRVAARRNQFANHNFPVTFQTYRLLHGKTHIGMFSKVKWLTAGGTPEQISLILASTTEGIIWEPPVYYIPVTQTFRDEFNLRGTPDTVDESEDESRLKPERGPRTSTPLQHRKPTAVQQASILEIEQNGVDFAGVRTGTWHMVKGTLKKTKFVPSHLKNRCEFADGLGNYWLNSTTRNFRMAAEFVNGFETSIPWSSERDANSLKRLAESGVRYNIPEAEALQMIRDGIDTGTIFEAKIKLRSVAATA